MASATLKAGAVPDGYVVRVEGRGTMQTSPAFEAFVTGKLDDGPRTTVFVDLSACEYLDSTFLGCLLRLHGRFAGASPCPFVIAASAEDRKRLFGPTHLEEVFHVSEEPVPAPEAWTTVSNDTPDQQTFGRHVMDCHRHLADHGGEKAAQYRMVADQLAKELDEQERR